MATKRNFEDLFLNSMRQSLGVDFPAFSKALSEVSPTSVFLNRGKDPPHSFEDAQKVPWSEEGRYLSQRPDFTFDPLFHAGCYYVMEPSSMFVSYVVETLLKQSAPVFALDLCAAPGGKSVAVLEGLPAGSLLVSNEVNKARFQILQYNLDKWGASNVARTNMDPSRIPWDKKFDLILVDAPCSGEGLFRKDKDALNEWSPAHVKHCSIRQRRILSEAQRLLAPGGYMIYSTCTYNEDENIRQAHWLMQEFRYEQVTVQVSEDWNIDVQEYDGCTGYQFYPHKLKGEGFFCAVLRKPGNRERYETGGKSRKRKVFNLTDLNTIDRQWIEANPDAGKLSVFESMRGNRHFLQSALYIDWLGDTPGIFPGTEIGSNDSGIFTPSYGLAVSQCLKPDVPSLELGPDEAIAFLKKETITAQPDELGWHVARHQGYALGWLKYTQAGWKNYFPSKHRILRSHRREPEIE